MSVDIVLYYLEASCGQDAGPIWSKGLDALGSASRSVRLRELTPDLVADKILSRTIVISKIPRGEASLV